MTRMNFSLRDCFWLMLAIGFATAWLITLLAEPKTAHVRGMIGNANGYIFLRRVDDGRIIGGKVRNGHYDLGQCPHGTYEMIFDGPEGDKKYFNCGDGLVTISGYAMTYSLGAVGDALPCDLDQRRDKNWDWTAPK